MKLIKRSEAPVHSPASPNAPTVTVYVGGPDDPQDVGMVRVSIPAGAGMPPHKHNGSDVIISPVVGHVVITKGEESIEVHVGDAALVTRDEEVSLANPTDEVAEVIVSAGPADFISGILNWPRG